MVRTMTFRVASLAWFATGVLLSGVVLLAFTNAWRAAALPGPQESTVVSVEPARILDTRDPVDVGLAGPLVSPVSQKLQVTGTVPTTTGPKVVVPHGATAALLNVTAIGATAAGFVSIRQGDASGPPVTSSLNFEAGDTVPNAVQVRLPTTGANAGEIDIVYDALGSVGPTVDLLIDVVGYTTSSGIQDLVNHRSFAVTAYESTFTLMTGPPPTPYVSVDVTAPVHGQVTVNSTATVGHTGLAGVVICVIAESTDIPNVAIITDESAQLFEAGSSINDGTLSGTRTFEIAADETVTYVLACEEFGDGGVINGRNLTAIFTPAP